MRSLSLHDNMPTTTLLARSEYVPPLQPADDPFDLLPSRLENGTLSVAQAGVGRVALVGCYLPRQCGIATFTADTRSAIREAFPDTAVDVYAMWRSPDTRNDIVTDYILEGDEEDFRRVAKAINRTSPDVVWLQHEFGIFGGIAGDAVLELAKGVAAPLAITFHTVLDEPDAQQRRVMGELVARASSLVVMTQHARETMETVYKADPARISVIEHGVPDRPFGRAAAFKAKFGFTGALMLTFGLISPGKGIESAIEALPAIVSRHPDFTYCIAGATHPNLLAREGEAYRSHLMALAEELGVAEHIRWMDGFLETSELLDLIEAADIYVTPYLGAGQSVSGTLSYAFALGKAVVSTPYLHAQELLDDGNGILVPFRDSSAIANAVIDLLDEPEVLLALQTRAYRRGRTMIWPAFAQKSMATLSGLRRERIGQTAPALPPNVRLGGVLELSDDCGIFQHSTYAVPDRAHGYCVDDNARALMLFARLERELSPRERRLLPVYAAFVNNAWNGESGFRNFMDYSRRWLEDEGSADSNGRSLWALGVVATHSNTAGIRAWAESLFDRSIGCVDKFDSPRAFAFAMLACDSRLGKAADHRQAKHVLAKGCDFLKALLESTHRPEWPWFEAELAYDNCRLPEALIRAGMRLESPDAVATGLTTLEWLMAIQTNEKGQFRPVGSDSFGQPRQTPMPFDQQPVEAWAAVDACSVAYAATRDPKWIAGARLAYEWFLGENDRSVAVGNALTGSCYDGITPLGLNANHGAESVLAFQLATLEMRGLIARTAQAD